MDAIDIAAIGAILLLAGTVKGLLGVGYPMLAVPLLATYAGVREAILLLIVPIIVMNIWQMRQGGGFRPTLRRFWPLLLTACIGIGLGTRALFSGDPALFAGIMGGVVCVFAVLNLTAPRIRLPAGREALFGPFAGLIAGLLGGISGFFGPVLIIYLGALDLTRDVFVRAVSLAILVPSGAWLAALMAEGVLDGRAAVISTFALAPSVAGMAVGIRLRRHVSEARFTKLLFGFLLIVGLNLVRKVVL